MPKRLLLIGPFPEPITGNSLSNKIVFEGFNGKPDFKVKRVNTSLNFFDENVGSFSFRKLIQSIKHNLQCYKVVFTDIVYITPGQTFFGILKYGLFIALAKLSMKRIIIHIHGNHLHKSYSNFSPSKKGIAKFILGKADKGIVLSESLIPNLTPFLNNNQIHVVYNFVEEFLVQNTAEMIRQKSLKTLNIIYLSNLMEEKGILDLLEALKIMEKKGIPYEARIAGHIDIKTKTKVESYIEALKDVHYMGVLRGEDKKDLLLWGNVFVFPSYYLMEGQPISLLEAMSTGNLILTTDHAGISDIFTDEVNGLYIDKKSPEDIVLKLEKIRNEQEYHNAMLYENYKFASKNFSTEAFINNLETVFKYDLE
ncbi:MAG: glycosyltransferase family 4 protein [Bacteroidia bacterium]|nr:glycosyltransferase family 4 protein [Bacteroidia bacterium]